MAVENAPAPGTETPPPGTPPGQQTPPKPEPKKNAKGEEIDDNGMTEAQRKEAHQIYTALQDPKRAKVLVETLAREAGLLDKDDRRSDRAKKSELIELLETSLGDDYKFLAPKLGPVFEKILDKHKEELDTRMGSVAEQRLADESEAAIKDMRKEYADFSLFENAIHALMDEIVPGENLTQKQYLIKLYKLAKSEAGDKQRADEKAKRNRQDGTQIPSSGGQDRNNRQEPTAPKGIRAAVTAAIDTLEHRDDD